jgi:hypothetical protein
MRFCQSFRFRTLCSSKNIIKGGPYRSTAYCLYCINTRTGRAVPDLGIITYLPRRLAGTQLVEKKKNTRDRPIDFKTHFSTAEFLGRLGDWRSTGKTLGTRHCEGVLDLRYYFLDFSFITARHPTTLFYIRHLLACACIPSIHKEEDTGTRPYAAGKP